jgi:putative membrane protein
MYDRLVHFSFGFLLLYPLREIVCKLGNLKGFWSYYIPVDVVLSLSALWEISEWAITLFVSPEQGDLYMGFQGDWFDSTKDMANALIGAILAVIILVWVNLSFNKARRNEFKKSFKIKEGEKTSDERKVEKFIKKEEQSLKQLSKLNKKR